MIFLWNARKEGNETAESQQSVVQNEIQIVSTEKESVSDQKEEIEIVPSRQEELPGGSPVTEEIPAQPDEYSRTAEIIEKNLQIIESNPESPEAMKALQALQAVSPEDMERYLKENNIGFSEQTAVKRSKSFRKR
jgi:hypothetical protein